jgi:predicted O-methyltransferase YrrM
MEGATMDNAAPRPETINALRFGADSALAMLAGMQLEVFTPLQHGPMTAEQIADAIGVAPTRLPILLYALVAAGLLTEQDGRFANTPEAQHFLVKDTPSYMGNIHPALAKQWSDVLVDFSDASQEEVEAFLRRINANAVNTACELLQRYDFSSTKSLVDVGGGAGGLTITMAKACPQLQATVIDLPQVTSITQKIVDEEGVADRVTVLEADVVGDALPGAYDVAIVSSLLQVLPPDAARRAVQHIGDAIHPGGTIYIIGQILDTSRTSPPRAVGLNLAFINRFKAGESYTEHEHHTWLNAAGFVDIERANVLLASGDGLIMARKRY